MDGATLEALAGSCCEFLVHGVDVEGRKLGVDEELVDLLGAYTTIPTTYAGGVASMVRFYIYMLLLLISACRSAAADLLDFLRTCLGATT